MKDNLFELEQKVEVVETFYRHKHLAVGSFGTVKKICTSTVENMYELRMDEDVKGIGGFLWPFFECELRAVE